MLESVWQEPLLYFKCFGTHYHHGDKGLLQPSWACLLAHEGWFVTLGAKEARAKEIKSYSPEEGNLLHRGGVELKNRKIDSCQSNLTHINQALLL